MTNEDGVPDGTVLVQLSDLHIGPEGARPYGTDPAANLVRVAGELRRMALRPAAVLLTGDLSDEGDAASYEHLRRLVTEHLEPLGAPVLPVVGNHDHRGTFRSVYLGLSGSDAADELPYRYVHDTGDVRIVMCDSYLAGEVSGLLGAEQLAWLDESLADAGDRATVVALHHPSVPRGVPRADDHLLRDADAFAEVLSGHDVAAVLCGHSHVSTASVWGGTLHVAAPATAYLLDPSRRGSNRGMAGAGFTLCTIREGRAVVNPYICDLPDEVLFDPEAAVAVAAGH